MPGAAGVPHPERAPRAPGRRPLAARRAPPEGAAGRGRRGRVAGSRVGDRGAASALPTRVPRGVSGAGVTVLSRPACPGAPLPSGERPAVPSPQCGAGLPRCERPLGAGVSVPRAVRAARAGERPERVSVGICCFGRVSRLGVLLPRTERFLGEKVF